MKSYYLLLLFQVTSLGSYCQDIPAKYGELIRRITEINNDSSHDKVTVENEEFMPRSTDGGGELTGYFKHGQIQKMTRQIWLSNGVEVYDYYFTDGKLSFIYETFHQFQYNAEQGNLDYSKTELSFTGRYYFAENKLVDSETTGHNRFEDDSIDIEKILLAESDKNLRKLQQKMINRK